MDLYIVTGASRGLGLALIEEVLKRGHAVASIARADVATENPRHLHFRADLSESRKISALAAKVAGAFKMADYQSIHLVNNAGRVEPIGNTETNRPDDVIASVDLNLTAPILLAGAFLKWLEDFKGWKVITNISSGVADHPKAQWSVYSAAKAGLQAYTKAVTDERRQHANPRVGEHTKIWYFNPGIMDTEMQATIRQTTKANFTEVEKFKAYARDGLLLPPTTVARALLSLLENPVEIREIEYSVKDLL